MINFHVKNISLLSSILFAFIFLPLSNSTFADDVFWSALSKGNVDFSARYRFEHVDDDLQSGTGDPLKHARAATLRTTLGYTTGKFFNLAGRLAFQDVRTAGSDDFNDATGTPGAKTAYAVVADPSDTDLLEGYINFSGIENSVLKAGRQVITYRNAPFHRFIGNILWRQNWQTFDAFSFNNTSFPDTTFNYAFIWNVNRIFSEEAINPLDNFESESHFINIKYDKIPEAKLEGYAYLLDFDNAAVFSTNTFGGRLSGNYSLTERVKAIYTAEYAHQSDTANNPAEIDANYYLGELGINFSFDSILESLTLKFSYELFEGEGGSDRFVTILGTNHPYQGWTDRFLVTPGDGIEDLYITVIAIILGANLIAAYHNFNSDNLGYDYGEELDLLLTRTFREHYTVGIKYAAYDADRNVLNITNNGSNFGVSNDVSKFWTWFEIKF